MHVVCEIWCSLNDRTTHVYLCVSPDSAITTTSMSPTSDWGLVKHFTKEHTITQPHFLRRLTPDEELLSFDDSGSQDPLPVPRISFRFDPDANRIKENATSAYQKEVDQSDVESNGSVVFPVQGSMECAHHRTVHPGGEQNKKNGKQRSDPMNQKDERMGQKNKLTAPTALFKRVSQGLTIDALSKSHLIPTASSIM